MEFDYYATNDGKELVQEEFDAIPSKKDKAWLVKKFEYYGKKTFLQLQMGKELDKVRGTSLWELKLKSSTPYRAICKLLNMDKFLMLHLFKKDYDGPIEQKSINKALIREKEYNKFNYFK